MRRRKTHAIQKWISSTVEDISTYFNSLYKMSEDKIKPTFINIDEVPINFDMAPDSTFHPKGEKEIAILSHSKSKVRMSLLMAIASDGSMLNAMMLFVYKYSAKQTRDFPRKYEKYKNLTKPWMLRFNESGFTTSQLIIEYIQKILSKHETSGKKVLVMDTAPSHINYEVKNQLKSSNIEVLYIPGGCTSMLQPLDVVINKPLKDYIRTQYLEWLDKSVQNNKTSSITPPEPDDVIRWAENAMKSIKKDLIVKSFESTGITKASQLMSDTSFLHK